jgi:hypothetical protein
MEHGDEAGKAAQVGAGKVQKGLTDRFEEEVQEEPFVGQDEGVEAVGQVKTKWKEPTGNSSTRCCFSHRAVARPWHLGQWRLRQEL